ncbi:hypothetical protein IIC38_09595 [candidate division KSB1 bacterium]|nr:hypothetical protein [candidate division KSB1 bacterium]
MHIRNIITDAVTCFKKVVEDAYVSVKIELEGKIASSEISIEYADKFYWRLVWQKLSNKMD